jgi:hypothetical protein
VIKILFGLLLFLYALSLPAQTNLSSEIQNLLPVGKCDVDVMDVVYPKRFMELSEKLITAVSTNKERWMEEVKKAKPGEPLPYDPEFGLTRSEYTEYLSLGEKRTMEKVGTGTLTVETNANSYMFDGGSTLPELTGLKINLERLTIVTPFATLTNPVPEVSPGGPALGAFSGYRWYFENGDEDKGDITTVSFLVGKLKQTGRSFIYYKGAVSKAYNPVSDVKLVIYYN